MNILYVCEEYPPGLHGGIGTMVRVLARELVKQGHNVYVAGLYPIGYGQADYEEDNGVKVWRLRYKADIGMLSNNYSRVSQLLSRILKYSGLLSLDTKISSRKLFDFIADTITKNKIDIIEIPDWNTFLHHNSKPIRIPAFPIPLVVKFNGSYSYFSKEMGIPINEKIFNAELSLMDRAEALASASSYTAEETRRIFNLNKEIKILYNAINVPAVFQTRPIENKVIFTGALSKKKGIISLLQAWNIVSTKLPQTRLHIFGKGPVDKLKKLLDKHAQDSVIFRGHVTREILMEELSTVAAAIFPSYSECFSFAPLEAMAAGCPVINSSRSSGAELVTDKVNGLLIDPDNINAIADAIVLMVTDSQLQRKIAEAGFTTVQEKFNIISSARDHVDFYNKVCDQKKSGAH